MSGSIASGEAAASEAASGNRANSRALAASVFASRVRWERIVPISTWNGFSAWSRRYGVRQSPVRYSAESRSRIVSQSREVNRVVVRFGS